MDCEAGHCTDDEGHFSLLLRWMTASCVTQTVQADELMFHAFAKGVDVLPEGFTRTNHDFEKWFTAA